MVNTSQPIVFFGTEDFSLITLKALAEAGYTVAAVVTKPDSPQGRGQKVTPPSVKVFAESHNIPVLQPGKLSEITDQIAALDNPAAVLVSYGKIIPQSIIDLFKPGIINVHPSLLPKYRGPSPVESAILNGDTQTGVSIMQLTAKMDAGPVYGQVSYDMTGDESIDLLYAQLGTIGLELLLELLPSILNSSLLPVAQQEADATYCHIIKKSDGIIDWNKPAVEIERQIRAFKSWPQSRTKLGNVDVIITEASVEQPTDNMYTPGKIEVIDDKGTLLVAAADAYLRIDGVKPLGKKEMPIAAFLSGYRSQLGV